MNRLMLLLALLAVALPATAFRCGTRVIDEGDHLSRVSALCGEPSFEESWVESQALWTHLGAPVAPLVAEHHHIRVQVWTYNRGPRHLMRQLRFENGRLRRIETLGYGYSPVSKGKPSDAWRRPDEDDTVAGSVRAEAYPVEPLVHDGSD